MSRRVVVRRFGGPEVLEIEEVTLPEPGDDAVRVRVTRAGVAFGDVMRRRGVLAPRGPFTPGYDVVGVVEAGDPEWVGARVAVLLPTIGLGGYAEHVVVPTRDLVRVPDDVDDDHAIALVLNYVTAWQIVHRVAALHPGQTLLVQGAAGGVGTALLDVGRAYGLRMIGTASARKHDVVASFGATPLDYRAPDLVGRVRALAPHGVDAATDPVGGASLTTSYQTLGPRGTLVFFGITGEIERGLGALIGGFARVLALKLRPDCRRVRAYGITVPPLSSRARCRADLGRILGTGSQWRPLIGARFGLDEVQAAHAWMESGDGVGKAILVVANERPRTSHGAG